MGLSVICDMYGMKRYLRKISKKSNSRFEHLLSIPANIVKKLELSESIVELQIKDGYFTVKKIGDTLESISSVDETEEDENITIHY